MEIRRGFEYGANADKKSNKIQISTTFDTNTRFIPGAPLGLPAVSDNFEAGDADQRTFDFNPAVGWTTNIAVSNAPWIAAPTAFGTSTTLTNATGI